MRTDTQNKLPFKSILQTIAVLTTLALNYSAYDWRWRQLRQRDRPGRRPSLDHGATREPQRLRRAVHGRRLLLPARACPRRRALGPHSARRIQRPELIHGVFNLALDGRTAVNAVLGGYTPYALEVVAPGASPEAAAAQAAYTHLDEHQSRQHDRAQ